VLSVLGRWWVKAAITIILSGLIVLWVGPGRIADSFLASNSWLMALSLAFTPAVIGIKTLRWQLLIGPEEDFPFSEALRSYLAGLALAVVTPLAAGEAGRGLFVQGGKGAELTGKVIIDKLVDLFSVTLFASGGLLLSGVAAARTAGLVLLLGVVVAAGVAVLGFRLWGKGLTSGKHSWLSRFQLPSIMAGMASTRTSRLIFNFLLSLFGFSVFYAQAFVILKAFWMASSREVVPYFPIITLSTILPIAIGGVGIREWTAVLLLRRFDIPEAVAFNAFFSHFVVVQLIPSLVGAYVIATFQPKPVENRQEGLSQ
jgi:uncharacterized protein (TIRG00374 family)